MTPKRSLSSEWASYFEQVMPANPHPVQAQECRRAFYAGAAAMHACVNEVSDDSIPDAEGAEHYQKLVDELDAFEASVSRGSA